MLSSIHARVKLRGWIALALIAAAALSLPRIWSSRFVAERRAGFHLQRARARQAAHETGRARAEFRAALRLEPASAEGRRELAAMDLGAGNWELAFLELQSLTEIHPELPDGWLALARLMIDSGLLEAPEAALDKAIDAAPAQAEARAMRGNIRFLLGRYSGARLDAQAAVAGSPKDATAWALLARATAHTEGIAAGVEVANRGIAAAGREPALVAALEQIQRGQGPPPVPARRFRPDAQIDRSNLGAMTREQWPGRLGQLRQELDAQLQRQAWGEAQRTVESARRDYPDTPFAPFVAGVVDRARDAFESAERHFREALADAPLSPTVVAALAQTWSRKQGPWFAGEELMRLAEREPQLAFARYVAARAYVQARDPIKAEAALRRGLRLQPDSAVPYEHLADYYFGLDRAPEALDICVQGHDRFPQDLDLARILAQIQTSVGRAGDAARVYEEILARRPDQDLVRYKLALLLASQEKDEGARRRAAELARELQSDRPSDPLLLDTLGWVQVRVGDAKRGRELLEAAVKVAPEDPGLRFHLGAVYLKEKRVELARRELTAALESPRPFAERLDAMRMLRENSRTPASAAAGAKP